MYSSDYIHINKDIYMKVSLKVNFTFIFKLYPFIYLPIYKSVSWIIVRPYNYLTV